MQFVLQSSNMCAMQEKLPSDTVLSGIFCAIASVGALSIFLFDFGNRPLSSESTFWAMPLACPFALVIYLKSKRIGAAIQLVLYSLAALGAYQITAVECRANNCFTQNPAVVFVGGMFAGVHMISMFAALVSMCVGAGKTFRSHSVA